MTLPYSITICEHLNQIKHKLTLNAATIVLYRVVLACCSIHVKLFYPHMKLRHAMY